MKKKRTKLLVFFALAGILVLFYMIGESYCEGLSGGSSLEEKNEVMCKYKIRYDRRQSEFFFRGKRFMIVHRNVRRRMMQFLN